LLSTVRLPIRENGTTASPTFTSTPAPRTVSTSTEVVVDGATASSAGATSAALKPSVAVNVKWVRSPASGAFGSSDATGAGVFS
jgi:hypothetical protein